MSAVRISDEVRQRVAEAAGHRCGYCQTAQRVIGPFFEIDHITPASRGGESVEENLWLACSVCNSHKADRVEALDRETLAMVRLFNPRTDSWQEHFEWTEGATVIRGRSARGRATIVALNMNHPDIVEARRIWVDAGWHPPAD